MMTTNATIDNENGNCNEGKNGLGCIAITMSTTLNTSTANTKPVNPAIAVSTTLSLIICFNIVNGVAPNARRIPISCVRSRTVTSIMLLTPITPDNNVPNPTIHTRKFKPPNNIENESNTFFRFINSNAASSSGFTKLRSLTNAATRFSTSPISTSSCAVIHRQSILSPLF